MDKREPINTLKYLKGKSANKGYSDITEALDFAIESVMLRDKYVKALERMIEGAKEINKFLEEAAKKSDEKHQLSGETSTISEKHQLMLPLDDAVNVVGRICDEWWTLEDGDIEYIRNELEQKCYRIDQTTDCISRADTIKAMCAECDIRDCGRVCTTMALIRDMPSCNQTCNKKQVTGKLNNPDDSLLKPDSEACKEQKSKLESDTISRQAAIEALCDHCGYYTDVQCKTDSGFWCESGARMRELPPVEPPKKVVAQIKVDTDEIVRGDKE